MNESLSSNDNVSNAELARRLECLADVCDEHEEWELREAARRLADEPAAAPWEGPCNSHFDYSKKRCSITFKNQSDYDALHALIVGDRKWTLENVAVEPPTDPLLIEVRAWLHSRMPCPAGTCCEELRAMIAKLDERLAPTKNDVCPIQGAHTCDRAAHETEAAQEPSCATCNDTGSVQDSEVPYLGNPCPDCK